MNKFNLKVHDIKFLDDGMDGYRMNFILFCASC